MMTASGMKILLFARLRSGGDAAPDHTAFLYSPHARRIFALGVGRRLVNMAGNVEAAWNGRESRRQDISRGMVDGSDRGSRLGLDIAYRLSDVVLTGPRP
jgi:hypothetical protein